MSGTSSNQPDERVAEHMKLVRLYGDESYGCTRKVADAYAAAETGALLPDASGMPRATASTAALQAQIAALTAERNIMRDNWAAVGTAHEAAMRRIAKALAAPSNPTTQPPEGR